MNEVLQKILLMIAVFPLFITGYATPTTLKNNDVVKSEQLYSVYSKDVDWIYLDSTITEIERQERTSLLKLINFTQNSGMEGRFLFCFILSLAEKRGFRYWMSSEELNEQILVVFLKSEDENFKNILENQYNEYTLYDLVVDSESEVWKMLKDMCGPKW